jgi:hypothetical protein
VGIFLGNHNKKAWLIGGDISTAAAPHSTQHTAS